MAEYLKDFIASFLILGSSFVLPYLLVFYCWGGSPELSLFVSWVVCSGVTAWLMGERGSDA
jgi:hypothetical protein